jgi:hypothetical protein
LVVVMVVVVVVGMVKAVQLVPHADLEELKNPVN